jgi:hypothetical protein
MKLKLNEAGQVVLQENKPVYIKDDGSEIAFDAKQAFDKIGELTGQAAGYRKELTTAKETVAKFGDLDVEKAQEALNTVANLDSKKLIEAGELDKVKSEIAQSFEPLKTENASLKSEMNNLRLENAFKGSSFVKDKLAIPADFAMPYFAKNFAFEDGSLVAKDASGSTIYSQSSPGEVASFDEALSIMVSRHPSKDAILKGSGSDGSGSEPNKHQSQGKTVTRTQFDGMDQSERASFTKEGGKVVDA